MDDFIGGRYSSTSCVGGVVLSLAFGPEVFARFLAGAHAADLTAKESDPLKNPAMLDALIGVYERNVLGYPVTAVLPYSQALSRFPAHLQQLDMESNGKHVNRFGEPVAYPTGSVIFGGLTPNKNYQVICRIAGNEQYDPSDASPAASVTTNKIVTRAVYKTVNGSDNPDWIYESQQLF